MAQNKPRADRIRPTDFDGVVGQQHLVGENGVLRRMCESGHITSMIFFGPPGTGKTTCASIIAEKSGMELRRLNATTASLSDIKDIAAETGGVFGQNGILLYLDEIQYFNKKQQQSLLEYLEDGRITLIASTTENPYYYVYDALLSRCSVFEFKPVSAEDMLPLLRRIADTLDGGADEDALRYIAGCAQGDVRSAVTLLDGAASIAEGAVTKEDVKAFAAVFYLAKLLEGGDLLSPCRRLLVIASEDIGAAYPMAAAITYACVESAKALGLPEGRIPLANAAVMLATAPKSNTAYCALDAAAEDIRAGRGLKVPQHLRSPQFKGYVYPHDYPGDWVQQQYLPDDIADAKYYRFGENKTEQAAKAYWESIKKRKL